MKKFLWIIFYHLFILNSVYSITNNSSDFITNGTNTINRLTNVFQGMVFVETGYFIMGDTWEDSLDNEKPVHKVEVDSFFISIMEISQREWKTIMNTSPSYFSDDLLPVEQVSWYDAIEYCNKRSVKEKLVPCYSINKKNVNLSVGIREVSCNFNSDGYRLPTEAEWEFAARGGNKTRAYKYSGSFRPEDVAWFDTNSSGSPHATGLKATNELGIYDMSGNVWEWCWDWYTDYVVGYVKNPLGPYIGKRNNPDSSVDNIVKVRRGGAWRDFEYTGEISVRLSRRDGISPESMISETGFRVVRKNK